MNRELISGIYRWLLKILLLNLMVSVALALYAWTAGWDSLSYSRGLVFVGLVLIVIGVLTLVGSARLSTDPHYLYTQAVLRDNLAQRSRGDLLDLRDRFGLLIMLGTAGLILSGAGILLDAFLH